MNVVLTVLHVLVCIFLIAVVLLQRGKGAEMGAVFGGGASSTVFGSRGGANFLTKMTTVSAALFMITSLSLADSIVAIGAHWRGCRAAHSRHAIDRGARAECTGRWRPSHDDRASEVRDRRVLGRDRHDEQLAVA